MKQLRYILPLLAIILAMGCNKADNDTATNNETTDSLYSSIPDAALAAKEDILAIIDSIPMGFNKDSFVTSHAHFSIPAYNIEVKDILKADSNSKYSDIPQTDAPTVVPYISIGNLVTNVVTIHNRGGKYSIGQLVDYPMSQELRLVRSHLDADTPYTMTIVHVYAIKARIYVTEKNGIQKFYYAVNNSTTVGNAITWPQLLTTLKEEITFYQNKFGKEGDANLYW